MSMPSWDSPPISEQADVGNRTPDLLITSELLCQLSYVGSVDRPKGGNVDSLEADGTSGNRSLARARSG